MDLRQELANKLEVEKLLARRESALGIKGYLKHVVINSSPNPRRFVTVADPWQWKIFDSLDQAIESVAFGTTSYCGPRSFWFTLPRGHDKTSGIARRLNWLLSNARRRLNMATAAADSDQAGLIHESMQAEAGLNPWIADYIKFGRTRVYGPGGVLKVLSSDAPTSYGLNCDIVIIDELTHWSKRDLWDVLISGRHKRPGSVFVVITNAGVKGSWQHELFNTIKTLKTWVIYESPERVHLASWMNESAVEEIRKMLPPGLAKRVLDNVWVDPGEDSGYLTRVEIAACELLGLDLGWTRQEQKSRGTDYVVGVDYGPRRDRTVITVCHHHYDGRIYIDRMDVIQGSPAHPVLISEVENTLSEISSKFNYPQLVCDPYQLEGTIQNFEGQQIVTRFEPRGGKSNYEMASTLRSLITNRRLIWYPGCGDLYVHKEGELSHVETFADELAGLVVKPTTYGYRFDTDVHSDPSLLTPKHDDRAVSVGMAALYAARNPPSSEIVMPEPIPNKKPVLPEARPGVPSRGLWGIES